MSAVKGGRHCESRFFIGTWQTHCCNYIGKSKVEIATNITDEKSENILARTQNENINDGHEASASYGTDASCLSMTEVVLKDISVKPG
ncbi:MAG: hypothetical protein EOO07_30350 [Chitinophagaceae bacterium]|nr:MAG: hypothetical protein EOO07_30350 [Chitinophagaceae bacterium]